MSVPQKICHPSVVVLLSLLSFKSSAGGLMVFSAVSTVSLFEAGHDTNDYVRVGRELPPPSKKTRLYASLQLSLKWSRKNYTAQLIHPAGKGTVWYLAVSSSLVSSHTLGPFHSRGGGGGGRRVLAVKVFAFTVLLAEQHRPK